MSNSGRVLFGKGSLYCDMSKPSELNLDNVVSISSKSYWDKFIKENPFFVMYVTESKCLLCCRPEPILRELENALKDMNIFSYPHSQGDKKKKKKVRKEIKIVRIDPFTLSVNDKLEDFGIKTGKKE